MKRVILLRVKTRSSFTLFFCFEFTSTNSNRIHAQNVGIFQFHRVPTRQDFPIVLLIQQCNGVVSFRAFRSERDVPSVSFRAFRSERDVPSEMFRGDVPSATFGGVVSIGMFRS